MSVLLFSKYVLAKWLRQKSLSSMHTSAELLIHHLWELVRARPKACKAGWWQQLTPGSSHQSQGPPVQDWPHSQCDIHYLTSHKHSESFFFVFLCSKGSTWVSKRGHGQSHTVLGGDRTGFCSSLGGSLTTQLPPWTTGRKWEPECPWAVGYVFLLAWGLFHSPELCRNKDLGERSPWGILACVSVAP